MVSKTLFCTVSMFAILSCWADHGSSAEVALPEGSAPAAIVARHFPDRVHEFVWRNWNVVEPARLAKVVGASVQDIAAMAESMGLPPAGDDSEREKTRGYITLIRRNWHLLPYDQLLELVEMTPEQLAFALREDDFLWFKLGLLKPKCEPLRYHPPDEAARRRAAEIGGWWRRILARRLRRPAEPRFAFRAAVQQKSPCPLAAEGQAVRAVHRRLHLSRQ